MTNWKKIRNENVSSAYGNLDTQTVIVLFKYQDYWIVAIRKRDGQQNTTTFKSRKGAIRYMRSWMRRHPKG